MKIYLLWLFLFLTLKIIFALCFYIQNVEVETRWHKIEQNKQK